MTSTTSHFVQIPSYLPYLLQAAFEPAESILYSHSAALDVAQFTPHSSNMSLGILPHFLHSQLIVKPTHPTTDCTGKTIIITGGNVGLGKEAARHYVRLNAEKVIITSRSAEKGETAKRDIEASAKRTEVVEVWPLNLLDYDSVKAFAKRAMGLKRLDIVVENAGMRMYHLPTKGSEAD